MKPMVVAGALAIFRMGPVLQVANAPFVAEIERVSEWCGEIHREDVSREESTLRQWREGREPISDAYSPEYFHALASGVALRLLEMSREPVSAEYKRLTWASIGNFWGACDEILNSDWRNMPTLAASLQEIENSWQVRDQKALAACQGECIAVFRERLEIINELFPRRRDVAQAIAERANWGAAPGIR